MAQSIKISDQEMEFVRREAKLSGRSIEGQISHWIRIGRSIERSPEFTHANIHNAFEGRKCPGILIGVEQEVFVEQLLELAGKPTPEQTEFFGIHKKNDLVVGVNKSE